MKIKQFFKRWKEGIDGVTVKQQVTMQIQSMYIILLGISLGILVCSINYKQLYWLLIILIGGYFNATIGIIGMNQKLKQIKKFEKILYDDEIREEVKTCLMK